MAALFFNLILSIIAAIEIHILRKNSIVCQWFMNYIPLTDGRTDSGGLVIGSRWIRNPYKGKGTRRCGARRRLILRTKHSSNATSRRYSMKM